jgi:nitroreductase
MSVLDVIRIRRSVRKYRNDPLPDEVLDQMLEALRLAPSACNNQPWRFIVVRDEQKREALAQASRNQMFMAQAPVIVAGCGIPEQAYKRMGGTGNSADIDVAIALDHLTLAAAEAGLGTCWIGAFDEQAVKLILEVPADVKVVALTPLGYPAEPGLLYPVPPDRRMNREQVIGFEKF